MAVHVFFDSFALLIFRTNIYKTISHSIFMILDYKAGMLVSYWFLKQNDGEQEKLAYLVEFCLLLFLLNSFFFTNSKISELI